MPKEDARRKITIFGLLTIIGRMTIVTPFGISTVPDVTLKVVVGLGASPGELAVIDHVT